MQERGAEVGATAGRNDTDLGDPSQRAASRQSPADDSAEGRLLEDELEAVDLVNLRAHLDEPGLVDERE